MKATIAALSILSTVVVLLFTGVELSLKAQTPATSTTCTPVLECMDDPVDVLVSVAHEDQSDGAGSSLLFASLSVGYWYACGVTITGEAYCWGVNGDGQLGTGDTTSSNLAVAVKAGGLRFQSVSVGFSHSCGITTSDEAYCWGSNGDGQLGTTMPIAGSTVPVLVSGGLSFQSVTAGFGHTCGVATTGEAYCWGRGRGGVLGDGSEKDQPAPVQVSGRLTFQSLSAGTSHTCGVAASGTAYCWGLNGRYGALGDGSTRRRGTPVPVAGTLSFESISTAHTHTCALTTDGEAYCWGYHGYGELGYGRRIDSREPKQVAGGLTFRSLSTGRFATCGVTPGGEGYCWGRNGVGNLGDGSTTDRLRPMQVSGGLAFRSLSPGTSHTCGIVAIGAVYCWGENDVGQLGDGSNTAHLTPVRIADLDLPGMLPRVGIVGKWESVDRSQGGIGNTLEFHADSVVTQISGAMVDFTYRVEGGRLITTFMDASTGELSEDSYGFRISGDTLRRRNLEIVTAQRFQQDVGRTTFRPSAQLVSYTALGQEDSVCAAAWCSTRYLSVSTGWVRTLLPT